MILLDKNYDQASDIWSAGIVLGELLKVVESSNQQKQSLFAGDSCYPMSPINKKGNDIGENDQIFKIFEKYKDINTDEDLSFVTDENSMSYLKSV